MLKRAPDRDVDVVLTDVDMPGTVDGFTRRIARTMFPHVMAIVV